MECSCAINVDIDGDGPSIYQEKMMVARKEHKCCECREVIEKGTEYEYIRGLWNGRWETYRACPDCLSLRKQFFTTYYFTEIWEYFMEEVSNWGGNVPEKCISQLTPKAREKVCEIIERYWRWEDE